MSEVQQAAPQGPEGVPVRPPSPPSRVALYIWAGIALFCLVMFGAALGLFLWWREAFTSKDLKTATELRITYVLKGNKAKSVVVNDPAEVKKLLDALEITDTQTGMFFGINSAGGVDFTLPKGKVAGIKFVSPTQLDRMGWGQVYVTPTFYRQVNEAASRAEGRPIDIMRADN